MDRVFESGAAVGAPAAPASPSNGYATAGNPATATPATKPGPYWYHMITESLRKLIVDAGLTPDHTNLSLVSQAVQAMIAAGAANDYKASVRAATVGANITLAGGAPNTLDGVTLVANDRILVKDQTTGSQNGIYMVTTLGTGANGTWTRSIDADQAGELTSGAIVAVEEGTTNADSQWMLTTDGAIVIGTTVLVWVRKDAGAAAGGVLHVQDQKASGTAAGTISAAASYLTRTLNMVLTNSIAGASLSANQITLPAGTYRVLVGRAPAYSGAGHRARLRNITDSATTLLGSSEYSNNSSISITNSTVVGRFTIAAAKVFELQHWFNSTNGGSAAFGAAVSSGENEVYAELFIVKE